MTTELAAKILYYDYQWNETLYRDARWEKESGDHRDMWRERARELIERMKDAE